MQQATEVGIKTLIDIDNTISTEDKSKIKAHLIPDCIKWIPEKEVAEILACSRATVNQRKEELEKHIQTIRFNGNRTSYDYHQTIEYAKTFITKGKEQCAN